MTLRISYENAKQGKEAGVVYIDGVNISAELVEKGHAEKYEEVGN